MQKPNEDIWICTPTGKIFHPLAPRVEEVCIEDIVQSIARTCRFNSGVKWPLHYSVAEHSVLLARHALYKIGDPVLAWQLLMHDAAEAIVGDMIRPLKELFPEFSEIEDRILRVIFERYCIPWPLSEKVKELDSRILIDEEKLVLVQGVKKFTHHFDHGLGITPQFWDAERARLEFISCWTEVTGQLRLEKLKGAA